MRFHVQPSAVGNARVAVPGDKSISHRALMLGGIAEGVTEISGFLAGEDCLSTRSAMQAMGVSIVDAANGSLIVHGTGLRGLQPPTRPLDLGNSGTGMRLMAGLLSGQPFSAVLTGDASLTGRPMGRVITPLEAMGADIRSDNGRPPLRVTGRVPLRAIDYQLPMASAQVKSAVLIAGLYADGTTSVTEPAITRDHTERMLESMGVEIVRSGNRISLAAGQELRGCALDIPGDLSSAAFIMLLALLAEDADVVIERVGVNPTRTGVIDILREMGADIQITNRRNAGAEPVADLRVRSSELHGGTVDPDLVSLAIDEFPVLFVAAARAEGATVFSGLGELRVKESDRIATMATGMRTLGIRVDESDDGAVVHGGHFTGGHVESHGDHRVAMSFAVAASIADGPITIGNVAPVNTSFPGFADLLNKLGVRITEHDEDLP